MAGGWSHGRQSPAVPGTERFAGGGFEKGRRLGAIWGPLSPQDGVCGALRVEMLTRSEKRPRGATKRLFLLLCVRNTARAALQVGTEE